jgi:hypothetical protein
MSSASQPQNYYTMHHHVKTTNECAWLWLLMGSRATVDPGAAQTKRQTTSRMMRKIPIILLGAVAGVVVTLITTQPQLLFDGAQAAKYRGLPSIL